MNPFKYWYKYWGTTSVLPTSFFLPLHQLYTHPTSTPNLYRKLVIATHLLRYRYVQRCGMNRYIQYHVSVHTFSYQAVVPTSAYYLMVSTLCMNPQLLPISHGATLTYLPYCRVTESFILLLPPIQSLHSEWVSHTPPLYAYDISPHLLASTHLHLSIVYVLWVYSCLFLFQSLLQLSHCIFFYHQTVYSFNYIVLHRSSCSTLHHSIWNKQYTS